MLADKVVAETYGPIYTCDHCRQEFKQKVLYETHKCPGMKNATRGVKHNLGKERMSLIPPRALKQVAAIYTYGEQKYEAHNWRKGIPYSELLDASLRHINDFLCGEDNDPESGLPHLAHACFGLLDILEFEAENRGKELDDRA